MKKFAFTKARLDVFIFASLLPLLILGCGILGLIAHLCFNKAFAITYLIFPLATVALLAVCMFSGMRRAWKIGLSVLILLVFALLFLGGVLFGRYVRLERYYNKDVSQYYASVTEENELMPALEEIGQPVWMEYCDVFTSAFIFLSNADYLICRYDAEEYELQKQQLEEKYTFQTEVLESYDYPCEPSGMINGYQFRVLSIKGEYERYTQYPWYMGLIAYSDEEKEIVYLSYRNTDLDYLTSLSSFLKEECGWQHIR